MGVLIALELFIFILMQISYHNNDDDLDVE